MLRQRRRKQRRKVRRLKRKHTLLNWDPQKNKELLKLRLKQKLIESNMNTKQTKREDKKLHMPKKLLKTLPIQLLKRLSMRPRELDMLKKIDKLLILPRKWKRGDLNSKTNMNMFGWPDQLEFPWFNVTYQITLLPTGFSKVFSTITWSLMLKLSTIIFKDHILLTERLFSRVVIMNFSWLLLTRDFKMLLISLSRDNQTRRLTLWLQLQPLVISTTSTGSNDKLRCHFSNRRKKLLENLKTLLLHLFQELFQLPLQLLPLLLSQLVVLLHLLLQTISLLTRTQLEPMVTLKLLLVSWIQELHQPLWESTRTLLELMETPKLQWISSKCDD